MIKFEISTKQRELTQKIKTIKDIELQIEKLNKIDSIKVSEHAIVRYLERVKGLDVQEVEKEILSPQVLDIVDKLGGSGTYPNGKFHLIMKDYTVITVTV